MTKEIKLKSITLALVDEFNSESTDSVSNRRPY